MAQLVTQIGFHYVGDVVAKPPVPPKVPPDPPTDPLPWYTDPLPWYTGAGYYGIAYDDIRFTYEFQNFFHPYVGELIGELNRHSLAGMFELAGRVDPDHHKNELSDDFFTRFYTLLDTSSDLVKIEYFRKEIDVSNDGPYANYNWELLFHLPLAIAVHLSKNQRFAEARRWFHYIFDPTSTDGQFWKFLAFRKADVHRIENLLVLLSKPDKECTDDETRQKAEVLSGYDGILNDPFKPHVVARTRTLAYEYNVVMKYLDNLIAWGDSLFMQDTMESINEATLLYVLAANILGRRPQKLPERGKVKAKTFAQLKADLDLMGNTMVDLESNLPFNFALPTSQPADGSDHAETLFGIGRTLYFCIPHNDKLLTYWDTVADRLFKLRHCMNIEGVVRQLALFDPPLDPGMLVKAAAAGIDIGSIVSGLNQPIGPVRSLQLIQKALELCGEVRGLGNALLSALEKGEGEHLALMRQSHEIKLQQLSRDVRFLQWKQAQEATESLLKSRATALERYRFYLGLLGLTPDGGTAPDTLPLDRRELTEENFDEAFGALVGQYDKAIAPQPYPTLTISGDSSPANRSGASGSGKLYLTPNEDKELNTHLPKARDYRRDTLPLDVTSNVLRVFPDIHVNLAFMGLGATTKVFSGEKLAEIARTGAEILRTMAAWEGDQAGMLSRTASYERRAYDWLLQGNLAARELMQVGRQILSSLIAEQVAHHEYLNIQTQIAQAQDVDDFLRSKFTNEELYHWMQGETSRLYYEYYRFAFDTARKAERTMKQELMRPEVDGTDYVKFNYWDGGRKGLLSGEALYLDVKRMEMAYHDNNKREFELTRHVSLRQLDPVALLNLRTAGECQISIPEWFYDRDCPGHYMRRLRNVAVSLPSVVGPYTSVNCTLSLLRSEVRKSTLLKDGTTYGRTGPEDDRFIDYVGSVQSIVTSGGNNDSGMFETNLRDERFLPFEGTGAISSWKLQLPKVFRPFDYMTIADVILHVRYTARQGGDVLGAKAISDMALKDPPSSLALLFSLRHDFPTEWAAFANSASNANFTAQLRMDHFPYMVQNATLAIDSLDLSGTNSASKTIDDKPTLDALDTGLNGSNRAASLVLPPDSSVPKTGAADVFLIVNYRLG
jgi:receptor-binding and translocation channel-forming TcA subunit of Tc toxin